MMFRNTFHLRPGKEFDLRNPVVGAGGRFQIDRGRGKKTRFIGWSYQGDRRRQGG